MMKLKHLPLLLIIFAFQVSAQNKVYNHPEWSYNKTIYEANIRQHSQEGTFAKFAEYVPELKKMGVGIIWLMPVQPIGEKNRKGSLGSYYSVKDYLGVNPEFGTEDDFRNLVEEIHKNGMYVIIDWVANHTAWDNKLTETNPEFYTKDSSGNFIPPVADWSDVIDLNYDNRNLHKYMTDALLYWVKEFDIDGYRCDVAEMVPMEFWLNARKELDKIKPVFMLAEGEKPELHDAFDMTYSWDVFNIMKEIASDKKTVMDLYKYLKEEPSRYPEHAFRMRFTTNHDENTWNGTVYEEFGDGAETFAASTVIIPGMPLLYSGQEAGLTKRLKFFDRDPIEWKEDKISLMYSKLFNLKQESELLYNGEKGGEFIPVKTSDTLKVFAFKRVNDKENIFAVFNFSGEAKSVKLNSKDVTGSYSSLFADKKVSLNNDGQIDLKAWEYLILFKED